MRTVEPTADRRITAKPRRAVAIVALAATIVVVGVVTVIWVIATDDGPVAAGDASFEVTFSGDGASYDGPREVIEGDASITLINETTNPVWFLIRLFDTGSDELADELAYLPEGGTAVRPDASPVGVVLTRTVGQEPYPVTLTLQPGTYIFDTGFEFANSVWRAGVIEVVAG